MLWLKGREVKAKEDENESRQFPFTLKNFHPWKSETQNEIYAQQSKNVMIRMLEITQMTKREAFVSVRGFVRQLRLWTRFLILSLAKACDKCSEFSFYAKQSRVASKSSRSELCKNHPRRYLESGPKAFKRWKRAVNLKISKQNRQKLHIIHEECIIWVFYDHSGNSRLCAGNKSLLKD